MLDVIKELKKRKVAKIYLATTFALYTEGIDKFKELYEQGMLTGVYTTNLSYIPEDFKQEPWLHVVDCSYYIAQIITNLHQEKSLSPILKDKSYAGRVLAKKFETAGNK